MNHFQLLTLIKPSLRPLPRESGGSHSKIYFIDPAHLGEILADAAADGSKDQARELGTRIGGRFLLKVGNIHDYVVKLKDGRESVIRRQLPSEAFGPGGYNLAPTRDKVMTDVREAVRQIPYMGFGDRLDQFAPDILGDIDRAIEGRRPGNSADGTFLVMETPDGVRRLSTREILKDDPFFKARVSSFDDLRKYQEYLRFHPVDSASEKRLSDFFNAPMTVGIRDVIRYLEGSRHPALGWERAKSVIDETFRTYGRERFVPPEFNYYTSSLEYVPAHLEETAANNAVAAGHFARMLRDRMPSTFAGMPDDRILAISDAILAIHFDYPEYEVDPHSGVISTATARLLLRMSVCTAAHLLDIAVPDRRNPISPVTATKSSVLSHFVDSLGESEHNEFLMELNKILWEVAMRGGIPDDENRPHEYRRINRTFFCFQELAQFPLKTRGVLEETVTLEDIYSSEGRRILESHPELPHKLLVFFIMAYRYYSETGHIPDLRPDDAGKDLFIRGIYGYSTRNVLVSIGKDRHGRPDSDVRFIDNRDQFKQYRRWEDRDRPLGFVKYGLRLLSPVARPGLERAIGMYTAEAAGTPVRPGDAQAGDVPERVREVLKRGVEAATNGSRVFLQDAIDDSTKGIEKLVRRVRRSK